MDDLFYVVVTAIISRADGRYLITRRNMNKRKWPGKWTVPGGHVSKEDFLGTPKTTNSHWYNVLINVVKREVKEEVGLDISNVEFLCDLAIPDTIIVSFTAYCISDLVCLQTEETDEFAWVLPKEAEDYDLIEGILEELYQADDKAS